MSRVDILSPHSADECIARLRTSIVSTNTVHGRVSGSSIRLRMRIDYLNGLQPVLSGSFADHGGGARFRGRVGVPLATIIFMAAWLIVLTFGALLVVIKEIMLANGSCSNLTSCSSSNILSLLAAPIAAALMISFGFFLVRTSQRLARDEPQRLVEFVGANINATHIYMPQRTSKGIFNLRGYPKPGSPGGLSPRAPTDPDARN